MKISYDKTADVVYIYLNKVASEGGKESAGIVAETGGEYPVAIDYDKNKQIIGIEIVHASKILDIEFLKKLEFKER